MVLFSNKRSFPFSFPFLGPGHTVGLHSVVLLTLVQDLGQGPGPTPIPPVDLAPVHAPLAGLIRAHLTLDAMDAVMDARERGPAPVQGLLGFGDRVRQGLLLPTGPEAGREQNYQDLIGLGLALLVPLGAAALVDVSHLLESLHHMK